MPVTALFVICSLAAQVTLLSHGLDHIRRMRGSPFAKCLARQAVWMLAALIALLNGYLFFRQKTGGGLDVVGATALSAALNVGSILSAACVLIFRAAAALQTKWGRRKGTPALDPGRRQLLKMGAASLAAAPVLLSGYGAAYAAKAATVEEHTIRFGRRLRVAHLSDIHAGLYLPRKELGGYVDLVLAADPDVLVVTGDLIANSMAFLPGCLEEIGRIRTRHGTFVSLGNHEHWYGKLDLIRAQLEAHGCRLLNNSHQVLVTDTGPFVLAGIDDLASGAPDLPAALAGRDPAHPVLLLSHHPEIFPQAAEANVQLTLSGHWHGGQIKLPVPWGYLSLAQFETPYLEGVFQREESFLYVSRGIGTSVAPVRLNAPPEVALLTLV
jgi:uncharacterized protein